MRFGTAMSSLDDVALVVRAEELGFDYCWAPDSPLLYADPFLMLAHAARETRSIALGTGLAVAGLRLAPVLANDAATLESLAPGRTFLGVGTGNTGMRTLGQPPMRVAQFREYVRVVRALLHGEEVEYARDGTTSLIRLQGAPRATIERRAVPIHVGAMGVKAQAVAAELGDAIVTAFPRAGSVAEVRANCAAAGADPSRRSFEIYALMNLLLLEPGESLSSPRAIARCGPGIMANVHYLVDLHRETGAPPPDYVLPIWDDYLRFHATRDPDRAHQQMHQSHYAYVDPDEERFVTPEMIRNFCIAGHPDEVVERLHQLEDEGVTGVTFSFPTERLAEEIEAFASQVIARYD